SQDQVYAEPILKEFEQQTGIEVRAVYDSESVKTVGLVNRLIAEKGRPQCDLFWNNEDLRTRQLAAMGVFEKWAAAGYRSRRIARWRVDRVHAADGRIASDTEHCGGGARRASSAGGRKTLRLSPTARRAGEAA